MYKIICFSDWYHHFESWVKEYEKRLQKDIEIIKLKPSKKKGIAQIVSQESKILKKYLEKISGYKILLFIEWKKFSTQELFTLVEQKKQHFKNVVFIVWWAYWVDIGEIGEYIDLKLSFSPMTFPHVMAYLMLLEQIYRIEMIGKWSGYHH